MLARVIVKSLVIRRRQLAVASMAVLLAATLVTTLVTLSLELGSKVGRELEVYGANLLLLPRAASLPAGAGRLAFGPVVAEGHITEKSLSLLESGQVKEIRSYAPYLYTVAPLYGQRVVVVGTLFDKMRELATYWRLNGDWVNGSDDGRSSIIGKNVAERFDLRPGDEFSLEFDGMSQSFSVIGVAEVGGSEDNQVFIPLRTAQELSGRARQLDMVQVRASTEERPLTAIASDLEKGIPGIEAKVVGQIARAEQTVLYKIQLLIGLITTLVLLVSALAVFSLMSASVLERTKEIGLMKALGARSTRIAILFLAEAWATGLGGGALGILSGFGLSQLVAKSVFDTYLFPQPVVGPITLAVALTVATLASLWPVRNALAVEPIVALKGE